MSMEIIKLFYISAVIVCCNYAKTLSADPQDTAQLACDTSTTPVVLDLNTGSIESLNYPNDYEHSDLCEWRIVAPYVPHGYSIHLDVEDFDTESTFDKLEVFSGQGTNGRLVAEYSGEGLEIETLNTYSDAVTLRFSSDNNINKSGFRINFNVQQSDRQDVTEVACSNYQPAELTEKTDWIESSNYPNHYESDSWCSWYIAPTNVGLNQEVVVNIKSFDVEDVHDYVEIYAGEGTDGLLLYKLSGSMEADSELRTGSSTSTVFFHSDFSVVKAGFKINYFVDDTEITTTPSTTSTTTTTTTTTTESPTTSTSAATTTDPTTTTTETPTTTATTPAPTTDSGECGSGRYDCSPGRNPCTDDNIGNEELYHPHCEEDKFVQCDLEGSCYVMDCQPGTVWDQDAQTCVVNRLN